MKIIKHIATVALIAVFALACNDGIDPISHAEPGEDLESPKVEITYPFTGAKIQVREQVAPINIQFKATDDIEIQAISIQLDGTEIVKLTDFIDFRRVLTPYKHETLTNGIHTLTIVATDLSGKTASTSTTFEKVEPYQPKYAGETFYMPFDGDYLELLTIKEATKVGSPGFADLAKVGKSYAGATDAYLTFPTAGLLTGKQFSAAFWYKVNASPDRAGILVIGPPDPAPETAGKPNNRKNGFRFFREGGATNQNFILNVGNGEADEWINGGPALTLDPTTAGWVHMAFTLSENEAVIYFNGQVVKQAPFGGANWSGGDILSIGSGAPRFMGWDHLSDKSNIDELRLFNKVLTQAEVEAVMNGN